MVGYYGMVLVLCGEFVIIDYQYGGRKKPPFAQCEKGECFCT